MNLNAFYETDKFILTPFTEKMLNSENYQSWFHDPEVTKFNSHGLFPYTQDKQLSFMDAINQRSILVFAICVPVEKHYHKHIGNISLQSLNWIYRSAEIAWVIGDKEYWGKGIATEAGRLVLRHGFERLNLHRIWSGTAATNIDMQKVFGKLGFTQEGVYKDGMFLNGEYVDIFNYFMLEEQWKNQTR